jgi:hypothetical protein
MGKFTHESSHLWIWFQQHSTCIPTEICEITRRFLFGCNWTTSQHWFPLWKTRRGNWMRASESYLSPMSGFSDKRKFEVSYAESRSEPIKFKFISPPTAPRCIHTPYFRVHCTLRFITLPRSSSLTVRKKWIENFGLLGFGKFIFSLHSQKVITVDLRPKNPKTTENTTLLSENKSGCIYHS